MLLALRSLWEATGGAVIRKGAGLLLALQSLVLEPESASGDIIVAITGVAANPQIGNVTVYEQPLAGKKGKPLIRMPKPRRLARWSEAIAPPVRREIILFVGQGVATQPRIGSVIAKVDVVARIEGVAADPSAGTGSVITEFDFSDEELVMLLAA